MKTMDIYVKNDIYQQIEVLKRNRKKRYQSKSFFVEGVRNINAAIENGWGIRNLIYGEGTLSRWAEETIQNTPTDGNYRLFHGLSGELSGKTDTSELMAIVKMREEKGLLEGLEIKASSFVVLFDRPSNKGNLGTLIRSCDALGAELLITTGHCVDLYDPDVISASMGSFFHLRTVRISENDTLRQFLERAKRTCPDFRLVGTTAHHAEPIDHARLSLPLMLMIGNETKGLSTAYKAMCDRMCTIPMAADANASSLNVSCAASIAMYEITRQGRGIGINRDCRRYGDD